MALIAFTIFGLLAAYPLAILGDHVMATLRSEA